MGQSVWGRDRELALAARALEPPLTDPVAVVVTGEAGIGKTTVWKGVLAEVEARGARILSARPVESEATLAFAAVADLLRDVFDEAIGDLPAPQRVALEGALLRADAEGSPDPRAVAFGFSGALTALARSGPLVVAVDDVQWLDPPSARVLAFALRRLDRVPVGVLVAHRADADPSDALPLGLDEALAEARVHRVRLGPLGLGALRELLRARLETRLPRFALGQIAEVSGGNPFLALELARALIRHGVDIDPGHPLPIPPRLAELLEERLGDLPDAVRRVLLLVAASPRPTVDAVAAASGRDDAAALLDAAVAADVVELTGDRIRFANPLLGTGLYSGSAPEERRDAHRRLAAVATDAEERARHLAQAADGPDERIAQLLEDAAQRARSHGAPDAAAQLAELSLNLTPDDAVDACTRRTANAGRYAFESAQIEQAEDLLQKAAGRATGPMRAEALLYLSRVRYHRRDTASASALAEEALVEAEDDPSLQASIHLELAAAAELSGDHATATERAARAVELAERSGDRTIATEALSLRGFYAFRSGDGIPTEELERAKTLERSGPPVRTLRSPAFHEANIRMWSDDLAGARRAFGELERRARDAGDEGSLSVLLALRSHAECWSGDVAAASALADEARTLAEWTGQRVYLVLALSAQALAAVHAGDAGRAEALGREALAVAEQTGALQPGEFARAALGLLELARGDARAADGWLAELVEAARARGPADPGTVRFVADEVEALIALDAVVRAEELLAAYEERAVALGRGSAIGAAARCRGLMLAARKDLDGALAAFDRALERQGGLGQPLETGRTLLAKGMVLRRAKQWAAARETLTAALGAFETLGAQLWAERTRSELARIGGRQPYLSRLTETEEQIASLVAIGLSNREVAERLFLSVSTVESNLRRAYRKLGVRSRAQLTHRLSVPHPHRDA
jgi:DNA-binding CsgD family transcriptional regulator